MSSTTIRSARVIRAMTLLIDPSTLFALDDRGGQRFQGEPGNAHVGVDHLVGDRLDEVGLPGAGGPADGEVLSAVDPFQGRRAGADWVGAGMEEAVSCQVWKVFPGWPGAAASASPWWPRPDLFSQKDAEDLGGVPSLRFRGGQHVRGGSTEVGHAHALRDRGGSSPRAAGR